MLKATPASPQVRSAYREVLKAINTAFRGDQAVCQKAIVQARQQFRDPPELPKVTRRKQGNPLAPKSPDAPSDGVQHALAVAQVLRQNVVQGQQSAQDPLRYKLNIHDETERGDNESVKKARHEQAHTPLKGTGKQFSRCS